MIGQITPETQWECARHAKFTASASAPLFSIGTRKMTPDELKAREKGDKRTTIEDPEVFNDGASSYIDEKVAEVITGTYRAVETFSMEWGKQYEPEAAFELKKEYPDLIYYGKENPVFIPYTEWSGGSPDSEIPSESAIAEIKCPENPAVHVKYCRIVDSESLQKIFKDCWIQCNVNMAAVAKQYNIDPMSMKCFFISYCPIVNPGFKQFHKAVILPDADLQKRIPQVFMNAEKELKKRVKTLKTE